MATLLRSSSTPNERISAVPSGAIVISPFIQSVYCLHGHHALEGTDLSRERRAGVAVLRAAIPALARLASLEELCGGLPD